MDSVAMLLVLILSIVLHEVAHGWAAFKLGDPTAKLQGRLSLNPVVHIDPLMSIIVPGMLFLSGSPFLFGAAKPVPYNPYNLTDQKYGEAKVAAAGPAVNILIALIFAIIIRFADVLALPAAFIELSFGIITLNIFLAVFNLLPIPPLDGSKILPVFLPYSLQMKYRELMQAMERNIFASFAIIFLVVALFLGGPLYAMTIAIARLFVGF